MKNILLFTFIWISFTASAQEILITPNPVIDWHEESEMELLGDAVVKNNSDAAKTYVWERTVLCESGNIATWFCDPNLCYIPIISTQQFVLGAGEEGPFQLHATFEEGEERGISVQIKVYELNNPEIVVDVMYELNECSTLVAVDEVEIKEIKLFPNPTSDEFTLSNTNGVNDLVIYNIIGAPVKQYVTEENASYSIVDLPAGVYTVQLLDIDGKNIGSKRVFKR